MAVDECLLKEAADEGLATLRFYQWSEPTLSLGYFQRYEDRATHAASEGLPIVRRLSGGGTLLHDQELTYSLCLPPSHSWAKRHQKLYRTVHQAAIEALREQKVELLFWDTLARRPAAAALSSDAFLCFERRTDDDLVIAHQGKTVKIMGSAQRRRRGAVLQHGALLLARSAFAPELSGLSELSPQRADLDQLRSDWAEHIAAEIGLKLLVTELPESTQLASQTLASERLTSPGWLQRK